MLPDFLLIPYPLRVDEHLRPTDRLLYGVIYWYQHMKAEKCIASNTTLAKTLKVEPHTVQSGLEQLEERRYILRLYADEERKIRTEIKGLIHFKKVPTNEGTVPSNDGILPTDEGTRVPTNEYQNNKSIKNKSISISSAPGGGKDIQELIDLFKHINPTYERFFKNTTQRAAISRLLVQFGREKLEQIIRVLPKTNAERYAPTITTPYELERDLGRLVAYFKRQEKSGPKLVHL
jgi:hypothetical protein